ncbi:MAG: efflux RND transporter permease subunit [Bdellovibrionaceae bacterium]|nr:efflux RND transporter permease subunit [Pseudobdellovibrionaceae bacterium]
MKIIQEILKRKNVILVLGIMLALMGAGAFRAMPRSLFPNVNYPRVVVEVKYGLAPLQTMEWGVSAILEKELRAVPGVRLVKSLSSRGSSVIDVFLNENEDISLAIQRVNAKIGEARALLPVAAEISVRPITADAFPAAEYCFTHKDQDLRKLRTFVEYTVRPLVMVTPGIFDSRVLGGERPEFSVELDARKLAEHNLSAADVNDRIKNSNGVDFLGPVQNAGGQLLAYGGKYLRSEQEIGDVVIDSSLGRGIRVQDLGKVVLKNEWKEKHIAINGNECVLLSILYQGGIDQKITSDGISQLVKSLSEKDPGLSYKSWDLNDFTTASTTAVLIDLLAGMLIIALVTYLFLRNVKSCFIALLSMPLAAALTFLAMKAMGLSINLMTLGGLTAAIGLVVDNTVIILEMYHHRRRLREDKGLTQKEALANTIKAVLKPMIFGTAAIALVFTPIGSLSGLSGMFFAPMAHVHTAALLISVIVALLFVPALVLLFDSKSAPTEHKDAQSSKLEKAYDRVLAWSLNLKLRSVMLLLVIPLLGLLALPLAQTGFLPEWDEGDIVIDYRAETPTGLSQTVAAIKPLEDYLRSLEEVDFFLRKVGTGLGEVNNQPFAGEFIVKLKSKRSKSVFELKDQINQEAMKLVPGYEFDLFQILPDRLNDLSGSAKPIVLHVRSDDEALMEKAAHDLKDKLAQISGLDSVRIEEPDPADEIFFDIDERKARGIEQNPSAVNEAIRLGLFSIDNGSVQVGPQAIPIRLRAQGQPERPDLGQVSIYTTKGGLEKALDLGAVRIIQSRTESSHIDGTPVKTVTAELSNRDLGSVVKDIQGLLAQNKESRVQVSLAGDYELQQQSFKELILAFLTGLAMIFMMALLFTNQLPISGALTTASMIPPVIGLLGCVVLGIPLDVSSFSGLVSVTGIAVANSFMALAAVQDLASEKDWHEAVRLGMLSRLRPILMTNLAAMAGFAPIALGLAQGDEILRPFSIAIICGLIGTLYSTLTVAPLMYLHFGRKAVDV